MSAPTQAIEAEQALLAAMLNSPRLIEEARYLLSPADLFRPAHQVIFAACCELSEQGVAVDPVVLMNHLSRVMPGQHSKTLLEHVGGAGYLHTLYSQVFLPANVEYYAEQIRNAGRMRSMSALSKRLAQVSELSDVEAALNLAASVAIELELVVDAPAADVIKGRYTIDEFLSIPDSISDWVVPELLAVQDAMMWLGDEGLGKSWLLRQFALCIACGINPLNPKQRIQARKVMLLDVENAENSVRRAIRPMSHNVAQFGEWNGQNLELLCRPGGMNLRRRADRLVIERMLCELRPAVLIAGPMYKLAPRGRDDWDTAAAEARAVLDGWRERFGVAFVLEHHMPKGDGKDRPLTPFGGSEWMRWVTHGRVIREIPGSQLFECTKFRGDREVRELPVGFTRAGILPWNPIWDPAEILFAKGLDPNGEKIKAGR